MAYPTDLPTYKLAEHEHLALKAAVTAAMKETSAKVEPWIQLFGDMYTGRDPSTGVGLAPVFADPSDATKTIDLGAIGIPDSGGLRIPKSGFNLLLSRLRQRVIATTPGVPRIAATALTDGAVRITEDQQALFDAVLPSTNLESQMERAAFLLPTQSHVGVRMLTNYGPADGPADPHEAIGWQAIEATHCGFEPHLRRFTWWTYSTQFGGLPLNVKRALTEGLNKDSEPNPWDTVGVTEVYHNGFRMKSDKHIGRQMPTSLFVRLEGDVWYGRRTNPEIGVYVKTDILRGPVMVIERGLDPAPNEDVSMPEVISWLPPMRSIGIIIDMINSEIQNSNTTVLYDKQALGPSIKAVMNIRPGQKLYMPVDVQDGDNRGVNATMRPVERNSVLPDLINTLNLYIALFDDVTGVGPLDRGSAVNPEKSATEASALVQASGRRNSDAIRVQSRLWSSAAKVFMIHQRDLLGDSVTIPQAGNLVRNMKVPDPVKTPLNLRVDPVAFENQGRQGKIDTEMLVLTTLTNLAASLQNPNAMRMVNESARRFLKAVGWRDGDDYMETTGDPVSRYVEMLETGKSIPVKDDDNHGAFIQVYQDILDRGMSDATREVDISAIQDALQQHQIKFKEASQGTSLSPVPGVSAQGGLDNQVAASALSGSVAQQTRQTLGR